jgi:hypothetical protein
MLELELEFLQAFMGMDGSLVWYWIRQLGLSRQRHGRRYTH